jgi:hypothetical protein
MTWKQFKELVESAGVRDDDQIDRIHIASEMAWSASVERTESDAIVVTGS